MSQSTPKNRLNHIGIELVTCAPRTAVLLVVTPSIIGSTVAAGTGWLTESSGSVLMLEVRSMVIGSVCASWVVPRRLLEHGIEVCDSVNDPTVREKTAVIWLRSEIDST